MCNERPRKWLAKDWEISNTEKKKKKRTKIWGLTSLPIFSILTWMVTCSALGRVDRPSGANARICGEEPRWPWGWWRTRHREREDNECFFFKAPIKFFLTEVLEGTLSKLLWLDMEGALVSRGGNDLLWCCSWECSGLGATALSKDPVFTAPW